jgi:hypothetical protein
LKKKPETLDHIGHAKGFLCGRSPYFTLSLKKETEPLSIVL